MQRFFERWREMSATLVRALLGGFCALCFAGAYEAHKLNGPMWLIGLFGAGGLFLAYATLFGRKP